MAISREEIYHVLMNQTWEKLGASTCPRRRKVTASFKRPRVLARWERHRRRSCWIFQNVHLGPERFQNMKWILKITIQIAAKQRLEAQEIQHLSRWWADKSIFQVKSTSNHEILPRTRSRQTSQGKQAITRCAREIQMLLTLTICITKIINSPPHMSTIGSKH